MLSTGAGHGNYLFFIFFYPYAFLLMSSETALISIILMFIQFPLYGALIGIARSRRALLAPVALLVIHVIAVASCFFVKMHWVERIGANCDNYVVDASILMVSSA